MHARARKNTNKQIKGEMSHSQTVTITVHFHRTRKGCDFPRRTKLGMSKPQLQNCIDNFLRMTTTLALWPLMLSIDLSACRRIRDDVSVRYLHANNGQFQLWTLGWSVRSNESGWLLDLSGSRWLTFCGRGQSCNFTQTTFHCWRRQHDNKKFVCT